MTADNTSDRQPSSSMFWASATIWLAVLGMIAVYVWKWRTMHWPPNYLFVAVPSALIALASIVLVFVGLKRLLIGPKRLAALGTLVIAVAPLLVLPLLCADLYWRGANLQPIQRGWMVDPVAFLLSDAADYEIDVQLANRVAGENVLLIQESGNEVSEDLVVQMDRHVKDISEILGQAPPTQIYWVRDSVFNVEARSMIGWAITSRPDEGDRSELRALDKHEVAHATISLLSNPDSAPPTVIVEGWAEMCSLDTAQLNSQLKEFLIASKSTLPLKNTDKLEYNRNEYNAPYAIGGALVKYLIDRWGGEKFLAMYRSSNDSNFRSNFESVYKVSWPEIESQFSKDFAESFPEAFAKSEAEQNVLLEAANAIDEVLLDDSVDEELWEELTDGAIIEHSVRSELPGQPIAYFTEIDSKNSQTGKESKSVFRYRIDGDSYYQTELIAGNSSVVEVTPDMSLIAERKSNEIERKCRLVTDEKRIVELREAVKNNVVNYRLESDLIALIRELQQSGVTTLKSLRRVSDSVCEMQFVSQQDIGAVNLDVSINVEKGLRAVRYRYTGAVPESVFVNELAQSSDQDWYVTKRDTQFLKDGKVAGESTTRMGTMDENQLRSFFDEVANIEPTEFSNSIAIPLWLQAFHYGAYAWWAIAGLFLVGFGLSRY